MSLMEPLWSIKVVQGPQGDKKQMEAGREEEPTADIGSGKDLKIGNRFTKEGTQ